MNAARRKASGGEPTVCPWCSGSVPADAATCPSCGAQLRDAVDGDVLGVTQVDMAATSKLARMKPGRLTTWLGAESTTENPMLAGKVEPLSDEVRREMLKLELAAIDAEIEAKATHAEAQKVLPPDEAGT